ncbi:MAG: TolC family outer membrane protein [Pseudorhodoplanes sp.]
MPRLRRGWLGAGAVTVSVVLGITPVIADTLENGLIQAYQNNPQINAQRAVVRQTDEGVPTALSGYRPRITATASGGWQRTDQRTKSVSAAGTVTYPETHGDNGTRSFGITATQNIYNGFQTANRTRQAEINVSGARETLRLTEQTVLLDAATVYMNLLQNTAILDLQKRNVEVIQEQLRQTRDRFAVGEVTRTDVAQAESRVAAAQSAMLGAQSNYTTSRAAYRRVIGIEPGRLSPGTPVDRLSPRTLELAIAQGQAENPSVGAAAFGIDAATLAVKISEGALYPTVNVVGQVQKTYETTPTVLESYTASVIGQVSIPIYQGGSEYAAIRQTKELVGQRRLELAVNRDQARANVVQAWGQLEAAKAQITATTAQVNAAEIALNGVREEARVGQRTTLDVLNAQQELVNARVALVTAQRDRVVASYTLLAAVGRLAIPVLGLNVPLYDPMVHYQQVRDSWVGVRTPDGR